MGEAKGCCQPGEKYVTNAESIQQRLTRLEACVLALVKRQEAVLNVGVDQRYARINIDGPWDELRKEKEDEKVDG